MKNEKGGCTHLNIRLVQILRFGCASRLEVTMLPSMIASIESPADRELMIEFYKNHSGLMYKEARKHLEVREDVDDIVYEALAKIIDKMDVFRKLEPLQRVQYALTTTRNLSYILRKRNSLFTFVPYDTVDFDILPDSGLLPEAAVAKQQAVDQLKRVWQQLESDDRMLLEQKYLLQWENVEIARQLGIRTDSVRMRLTRAKRRLMGELTRQGITLADWE